MVIFDTNIVIDYLRGDEKVGGFVRRLRSSGEVALTSINKYELMKKFPREPKLESLLGSVTVYPFDAKAAAKAAELWLELKKAGRMIDEVDLLIASIAITNDELLVTRDRSFGNISYKKILVVE